MVPAHAGIKKGRCVMGILGFIAGAIAPIMEIAKVVVSVVVEVAKVARDVCVAICKSLGIVEKTMEPDELGDRVIQAEEQGITKEQFDTYAAYLQAVQRIQLNPERSAQIPQEDKIRSGLVVSAAALLEKFPSLSFDDIVVFSKAANKNPQLFNDASFAFLGAEIAKNGPGIIEDISKYLNRSESSRESAERAEATLTEMVKEADPEIDDEEEVLNRLFSILEEKL